MKIIGITGKSGSGKSTLAASLAQTLNCPHIDIDQIGHNATDDSKILNTLCSHFGTQILDQVTQKINRKKLGSIVFADANKMQLLTDLTWSYMQKQLNLILKNCKDDFIILEWILLPGSSYWNQCHTKIFITANPIARKNKVIQRDHISEEYFEKRDSASFDYTDTVFDLIFENDYQLETIQHMIENILSTL